MIRKKWKAVDRFIRSAFMMPMYQLEQYAEEDAGAFKLVCAYKALFKDLM